jgi:hypothetical protein
MTHVTGLVLHKETVSPGEVFTVEEMVYASFRPDVFFRPDGANADNIDYSAFVVEDFSVGGRSQMNRERPLAEMLSTAVSRLALRTDKPCDIAGISLTVSLRLRNVSDKTQLFAVGVAGPLIL